MDPKIIDILSRPGVQSSEVVVASVTAILQVATALGTSDAALQRHAMSCVTLIVLGVLFSRGLTKFAAALACRKHADADDPQGSSKSTTQSHPPSQGQSSGPIGFSWAPKK